MTASVLFALMAVIGVWALAAFFIWQWGPGVRECSVWCPVFKKRATVLVQLKEALFVNSYAGLSVCDVKECSLFKFTPLACRKQCLQRL